MNKQTCRLIIIILILALCIGAISYFRLCDGYELLLLDLRFQVRPAQKVDPQIAIIEIGNDTLANLGRWPISRDYHATLIKVLAECGVKAIVFDVLFSEPTDFDPILIEATKEAGRVYYPYSLKLQRRRGGLYYATQYNTEVLEELAKAARGTGHANVLVDSDGKRRRIPLFIQQVDDGPVFFSQLSFKAAADYLDIKPAEIKISRGRFVQLDKTRRIPIDEQGAVLVNLAGRWQDTFVHYSYYDILAAYAQAVSPGAGLSEKLTLLKDKVCFVGLTATGTTDINPSALETAYPMIGLHANLFNSIITRNFLRRSGRIINLGILYFLCLVSVFINLRARPIVGLLYQAGLLTLFTLAAFLLFNFAGLWIDLFFPLAGCVAVYLGTNLWRYIHELQRRQLLEQQLSIARNIQRSFLKDAPAKMQGVDICVSMDTAHHVGGDLYDFVELADGRIGLMVGDVSGKGIPAALFMAQVISQFRYHARTCATAAQTMEELNRQLAGESQSGLFVTMAYLIYSPQERALDFSSAGHLPPLVLSSTQTLSKIEVDEGMPLGLVEEAVFEQQKLKLATHDLVLLYTDGVTEARDKRKREFGEKGIIHALKAQNGLSAQEVVQALKWAINHFVGKAAQHDDITIMALKV